MLDFVLYMINYMLRDHSRNQPSLRTGDRRLSEISEITVSGSPQWNSRKKAEYVWFQKRRQHD